MYILTAVSWLFICIHGIHKGSQSSTWFADSNIPSRSRWQSGSQDHSNTSLKTVVLIRENIFNHLIIPLISNHYANNRYWIRSFFHLLKKTFLLKESSQWNTFGCGREKNRYIPIISEANLQYMASVYSTKQPIRYGLIVVPAWMPRTCSNSVEKILRFTDFDTSCNINILFIIVMKWKWVHFVL